MKPKAISLVWALSLGTTIGLFYFPLVKDYSLERDPAGTLMWAILMFLYSATIIAPSRFLKPIVLLITLFYFGIFVRFLLIYKDIAYGIGDIRIGTLFLLAGLLTTSLTAYFITRRH